MVEDLTKLYIEECDKIIPNYSQQKENSLEKHLQEVRVMFLANSMYFIAVMIQQQTSIIPTLPFDPEQQMVSFLNVYVVFNFICFYFTAIC